MSNYWKQIANVMVQTHSLDRRYGTTMVVNNWTGSKLDPFDSQVNLGLVGAEQGDFWPLTHVRTAG